MKFVFVPNESIGEIMFGIDRNEIKAILNGFRGAFKKNKFSKNTADDFGYCHVYYDVNNKCNAVEFFAPNELLYNDENLFDMNETDLKNVFPDIIEEYGSYISLKYSIGVVFNDNKIESILVGCKDYYS